MIGIDIVEISRLKRLKLDKKSAFVKRFFTAGELKYCHSFKDFALHLSGHYAAKEAVRKALGNKIIGLDEIEVKHNHYGQPEIWIKNKKQTKLAISISHTDKIACAIAILCPPKFLSIC